jgi:uncharacterized Zn-binding protein involved in type VI secretion
MIPNATDFVELPGRETFPRLPRGPRESLGGPNGKPAGRLGDKAFNPADAHGCPACPHPVIGPAIQGSPNVYINGRPALRTNDPGVHAACCGPNHWQAAGGTPRVLINGLPAHRKDDKTQHCGGVGSLTEGSANVLLGGDSLSGAALQNAVNAARQLAGLVRR